MVDPTRAVFGALILTRRRAWVASKRMFKVAMNMLNNYLKTPIKDTIVDRIMTNETIITSDKAEIVLFCDRV